MPTIDALQAPNLNLSITEQNGRLIVGLDLPASSGSERQIPFLEVTRNESRALLAQAQQIVTARLSQSGFQIGEITVQNNRGATAGIDARVPQLGRVQFEITNSTGISGSLRNNPDVAGAIRAAESDFDRTRQGLYEQRARNWAEDGGATIRSGGRTWTVTPEAAADFYNQQRWWPWEKIEPAQRRAEGDLRDGLAVARGGADDHGLRHAGHPFHRQYQQALQGLQDVAVERREDAAALLVQAAARAGFDRNGDLRVVVGTQDNLFAVQGEGPAALRAPIARADIQPRAFDAASQALAQQAMAQQQDVQQQQEQQRLRMA